MHQTTQRGLWENGEITIVKQKKRQDTERKEATYSGSFTFSLSL